MNAIDGMNKALRYIEEHLADELNYEEIAAMAGCSAYHFQRMFLMLAGVSLADYIRRRRLSMAAVELQAGKSRVLDTALKYGYSSPNSFHRAFKAMHGVPPAEAQKKGTLLKAYPPLFFEFTVRGTQGLDYWLEETQGFRLVGKKLHTTVAQGESLSSIPAFWQAMAREGGPGEMLALMNAKPMGLLGVSDYRPDWNSSEFDYYIGVSSTLPAPEGMAETSVPEGTWAVFSCKNEGPAAIQKLQNSIIMDWLPDSGFEFANAPDMERYDPDGRMEIWLPVVRKG